ncbi:hypothetical protein BCR44DRAFT_1438277 [Catenaria anguillulae PL171]|uniref:Uncharacterized protein n=1 Tax=Catenaria anguillulae PL171 TaxID=765915 RepID=A0A1Y2HFH9_9FUNG|nr:hypothetical protein BCR44DRAFT_1438277 [Catenaria anguillulae PL171]
MIPQLILLATIGAIATAAPLDGASNVSAAQCKSFIPLYGKDLIFSFDQGASYIDLPNERSVVAAHANCFEWAKSQGYYVAVATADAGSPQGRFRCYGKNVPHYPEFKGNMKRLIAWREPDYLGPYDIPGYDIQVPRVGVYGQGMSFCDSYVEVGGEQYCKGFPKVEHSTLLLAKDCPKSQ